MQLHLRVDRALCSHELLLVKVEEVAVREAAVAHEDAAGSIQLGDDDGRVTFLLSLVHDQAEDVALLLLEKRTFSSFFATGRKISTLR